MVSALESTSRIPALLYSIFGENFTSKNANFKVTFKNEDGTSEFYTILNEFPVKNENNNTILMYMKPLENEAYGIIFEKVWAAYRGGYKNLEGGQAHEVLDKVLGTSSEILYNDNIKIFNLESNSSLNKNNSKIQNAIKRDKLWNKKISVVIIRNSFRFKTFFTEF